jgi:hypothetical protein
VPHDLPAFVGGLTPVVLRADTLVTAHRFDGDRILPYQSVLPTGTAVLVDAVGLPRVRCSAATPLAPPHDPDGARTFVGPAWPGFDPAALVTIPPAATDIAQFGLLEKAGLFRRPAGSTGRLDIPQVPTAGVLDGSYTLDGKQNACDLRDCEKAATIHLELDISGCPRSCEVRAPAQWAAAAKLIRLGSTWFASALTSDEQRFDCGEKSITTRFSLGLGITESAVIDHVWTATRLKGTARKSNDGGGDCRAARETWNVTGER